MPVFGSAMNLFFIFYFLGGEVSKAVPKLNTLKKEKTNK